MISLDMALSSEAGKKPRYDLWLLVSAGLLIIAGFLAIYSVDHSRGSTGFIAKQLVFGVLGIGMYFIFKKVELDWWRRFATPLWIFNVLLLVAVHFIGDEKNGSQRWIEVGGFQFQPSELSKLFIPLTLAAFFVNRQEEIREFRTLALSFAHIVPTVLLLVLQPHYGGALTILAIWLMLCLYSGVPWKSLAATFGAMIALFGLAVFTPLPLLQDYHKERLKTMVSVMKGQEADRKGSFYQQYRSIIAIGTGGVNGTGFLNGEQKTARYIPEQQNDFIFSVIGEEGGLIGSSLIILLFGFFFYRVWLVGYRTRDVHTRLVAGGIFAVLATHTMINLFMVLGVGPVVGLWLPFVSYGGTALLTCMAMVGLLDRQAPAS